jgi:hypothetical protein
MAEKRQNVWTILDLSKLRILTAGVSIFVLQGWAEVEFIGKKVKLSPLQAWTGPWGSRRFRIQNF